MDVNAVADELYGLPLDEFTAARNAYVKQARQNGDRDAAATIQALGKPTAAAGLANQLVRRHRAELAPLLELGASLRAAMASLSGAELRTLGQQQHRLISALVGQARSLAAADGRAVNADQTRGLEETLHAALADEGAASELMAGRLTETLQRSGLGSGGSGGAGSTGGAGGSGGAGSSGGTPLKSVRTTRVARTKTRSGAGRTTTVDAAAERERDRRERAERAALAARDAAAARLDEARTALTRAETDADDADAAWDRATATVAGLRAELDRATVEQSEADRARRRRHAEAEQARRAERTAQLRLDGIE